MKKPAQELFRLACSALERAGAHRAMAEAAALLAPAQPGTFGDRQQGDRRDDGHDEAEDVELHDVAAADRVRHAATDDGADHTEDERPQQTDVLLARQQESGQQADDEPRDDETDH